MKRSPWVDIVVGPQSYQNLPELISKVDPIEKNKLISIDFPVIPKFDQLKSKHSQNIKLVHSNYEDHTQSLQKFIEVNDSLRWVEFHMNSLPRNQKLILQLRDIEHFEFNEIAEMLDMNETTIRVSLSRARKTIREKLTQTHNYGIK